MESIRRNDHLAERVEHTRRSGSAGEIDEFWRKLVDSEEIVAAMEHESLSRTTLREAGTYFAKMQELRNRGINPDRAARGAALEAAIDKLLVDAPAVETPEELAALAEKAMLALKRQDGPDEMGPPGRQSSI